jgi:hypothetical protein
MVSQKHGIPGKTALRVVVWIRQAQGWYGLILLGGSLWLWWGGLAYAKTAPCQDSLARLLTQMYLKGSYCTCAVGRREVVTEAGRIHRHVRFTLPGLSLRQRGPLPDLSQVLARFWGTIIYGPGGQYTLSVRIYEEGRKAEAVVLHHNQIQQGREFEITAGPQHRLLLRTRTTYHVTIEGRNPQLRPRQRLILQGRACLYLVSGS